MGQPNQVRATTFKVKAISALMLSVWVFPSLALELGRLQLQSAIGEPLRAEVQITKALPEELRSLRVQLAPPESFRKAGMEFNPALRGLTATLKTGANGATVIALSGREPVQDNFIDLVIESQWATGNLIKNYAILLNAVNDRGAAPASAAQLPVLPNPTESNATRNATANARLNPSSVEVNAQKVPVYRFDPVDNKPTAAKGATPAPAPAPAPATVTPSAPAAPQPMARADIGPAAQATPKAIPASPEGNTVTVMRGDTASRLAMRHLMPNISLDQMLLAMLKANPDAFIQDNVNLLKAGAVLRIPSASEASQTSEGEARQIVIAQTRDFAEYARRLAESPLLIDSRNTREMTGKVGIDVQNSDGQVPQQDKLTLSKPQVSPGNNEAKLALQREKQDSAEKLASLNQNLKDLQALASATPAASTPSATGDNALTLPVSSPAPDASAEGSADLLLERISQNKDIWIWAAGLLALILIFVLWVRKKSQPQEDVYAPSYNDIPERAIEPSSGPGAVPSGIPPQMSSIDLNLNSAPTYSPPVTAAVAPPSAPATPAAPPPVAPNAPLASPAQTDETENNKLNLAQQLVAKGDHDLARALILSVASSASGDLKSRALQMLGQIR